MKLVIDANVLFSILLKPGKPVDLIYGERVELFAPATVFQEIKRH